MRSVKVSLSLASQSTQVCPADPQPHQVLCLKGAENPGGRFEIRYKEDLVFPVSLKDRGSISIASSQLQLRVTETQNYRGFNEKKTWSRLHVDV